MQTTIAPGTKRRALAAALPHTLPVLTGYGFLGMAYGILMKVSGFGVWYSLGISALVFGGSLQYVMVSVLAAPFAPVATFLMALMLQARHLFYGIAMLDKYKAMGAKRFYLIFGLTDETFSINCAVQPPAGVDEGWFMFFVTLLNHCYWVAAGVVGSLLGGLMTFNTEGLDFVMTAMFAVIFLEQWLKEKQHLSSLIGLGAALGCRLAFGPDSFLVPAMVCILALLAVCRRPIEAKDPTPEEVTAP